MKEVYVLIGFYHDHSGVTLLGVYSTLQSAEDRRALLDAAGGGKAVRVVKMPIDKASPQEVF